MKLGKKLWSILLAIVMVLAMAVPAVAANATTTDIVITSGASDAIYSAWRLLDAKEDENGKFKYSVNEKYMDALKAVIPEGENDTSSEIVAYISKLSAEGVRTFADAMYEKLKDTTADATSKDSKFENAPQGYYLIAETTKGADPDTVSKVMLDTKGKTEVKVETKEGTVDFEKKVKETNDTTGESTDWQDGADYDIGDDVPFQLTATLPNDFENYTEYKLTFHDKQSAGLTFKKGTVKVLVDDTEVDATKYAVVTENLENKECGCTFEIVFDNLRNVTGAKKGSVITVQYSSTLNENAIVGSAGNPNEAYVEYTNGSDTDETVRDVVIVFTYEFDVNKVDKDGNALEGAGFTLYKEIKNAETGKPVWEVVKTYEAGKGTEFAFSGLDSGRYKLEETTVPAGYNQADDIVFTITATYDIKSDNPKFGKLTITGITGSGMEDTDGQFETDVINLTGVELPSTGGIGTTIFYVAGGILVVGAAVMLIAKKRTENEE